MSDVKLPRISVVVTCYNCRDYIGDAIHSVARQTLHDFECVVVDDASTDDSAAVVQQTLDDLADPRFSLLRLEKNVGQTGATRRGLAATRATFVCFLDSDDLWNRIRGDGRRCAYRSCKADKGVAATPCISGACIGGSEISEDRIEEGHRTDSD